jgi:hypothetical protein
MKAVCDPIIIGLGNIRDESCFAWGERAAAKAEQIHTARIARFWRLAYKVKESCAFRSASDT